ncbi:MAG: hypothetical protein DIZ80_10910 [endosymbiont of Galathealinum brachiosum]|uniref:AAA+ ATPase domain-containing protein n=1 Tax=endosymbiont of Galathealinum brachiosum TaxID=2200906 RepID=A0A370DCZ6_9GAMM|nr:MAG: hypothetical protein DIZ80_10910 [endosymbiont of Galathealinum brachiosum]
MYESFYGLTEKPFTLLPDPDYLYLSPKHQRALTLLEYGMMNQAGFSVICGDTGAGKTTLIRRLLTELGDDTKVGLINNTHHSFGELLNWVLMAFGIDGDGKSKAQMHQMFIDFLIEQYAQNKHTVLIVDEAQNMKADTLEELRMLSNINSDKDQVLQVILAGQPALRETLRQPELMQFAQRIAVDYYLESLSVEETNAYIHHRLKVAGTENTIFTDAACEAIFKYSGGTPRLINLLCDTALVYGFAEQSEEISEQLVHDVVREQHSNSIIPTFNTDHSGSVSNPAKNSPDPAPLVDVPITQSDQKISEQSAAYEKTEKKVVVAEPPVNEEDRAEKSAELLQQASQQTASVVGSAESTAPVSHTESLSGIEKAQIRNTANDTSKDESNVTPIKAVLSEAEEVIEELDAAELEDDTDQQVASDVKEPEQARSDETFKEPVDQDQESGSGESSPEDILSHNAPEMGRRKEDVEEIAPYMSRRKRDNEDDDVYPIVHIEENPNKGFNMVVIGVVGGMFVASIIMMIAAWTMFGSKDNIDQQAVQKNLNQQLQLEDESRELKALQKERDAALAVTRALERERDAAITAAKAQEEIRAAELRAAEILAEQQRRADKKLQQARARIREAELAESKALAREHEMQLAAERKESELENERLRLLRKERIRLEALAVDEEMAAIRLKEKQSLIEESEVVDEVVDEVADEVADEDKVQTKPEEAKSFSSNPCNSPSAKFLSTCKK